MIAWAWLLICQLFWTLTIGVPQDLYHTATPQWINLPAKRPDDSYFGFSITYAPANNRLIVSAPQEDETGEVYSCDLSTGPACTTILRPDLNSTVVRKNKHYSWFGANVKAGPSFFVTCAPRHLERVFYTEPEGKKKRRHDPGTFSRCFKYEDPATTPIKLKSFTKKQRLGMNSKLYEHYMDSLGWSIDVSNDDILIGGPALYTGRVLKYIDESHDPIHKSGYNNELVNKREVNYNYGYSVLMGHFQKSDDKPLIYAVGSPYGIFGAGKILFYEMNGNDLTFLKAIEVNDDFGVGSMFGAVMCAARLTPGSQVDWLIVGAQTYADTKSHHYNQGAVFIYEPSDKLPPKFFRKLIGKDDSFFGSSIATLGDFNGDEMDEIAIAAPYEGSGTGAVYLYSSRDIKNTDLEPVPYMQRITPEPGPLPATMPIKSFGLSLASIQDYDENGCNELAIGAPESSEVLLVKCIAAVTAKIYVPEDELTKIKLKSGEDTKFILPSCIYFGLPEKPEVITGRIKVSVSLTLDGTKLIATPSEYEVTLQRTTPKQCQNVHVVAPRTGNYEYPIRYNITGTEMDPPKLSTTFNPSHVALSDLSQLEISNSFWLTDCANVTNCAPKLILHHNFDSSLKSKEYLIGSSANITLFSSVHNEGEAAYDACVRINLYNTDVAKVPMGCERIHHSSDTKYSFICRPDQALRKTDKPWVENIPIDTSRLNSEDESIDIKMAVFNHCSDRNKVEWRKESIALIPDRNIHIKGMTDSGLDHNVNMTKEDETGKEFEHTYIITNNGVTNWINVEAIVKVQTRPFIYYSNITASPKNSKSREYCQLIENVNDTDIFSCVINSLYQEPWEVKIPMLINYQEIGQAVSAKINTQSTSITLKLNGVDIEASEKSQLNFGTKVAIWIIVVAVLVGIFILLFICWLLNRCGFFKREKKASLERVRHSVRRQTIMRRTMMEGVRLPLESERRSLVTSLPEESAEQAAARDRRVRLDSNATRKKK